MERPSGSLATLDRHLRVVRDEQKHVVKPLDGNVGLNLDRPDEIATLRVEILQRGNQRGIGRNVRPSQFSEFVENTERVDPSLQNVGAWLQRDPVKALAGLDVKMIKRLREPLDRRGPGRLGVRGLARVGPFRVRFRLPGSRLRLGLRLGLDLGFGRRRSGQGGRDCLSRRRRR